MEGVGGAETSFLVSGGPAAVLLGPGAVNRVGSLLVTAVGMDPGWQRLQNTVHLHSR